MIEFFRKNVKNIKIIKT